MRHVAPRLGAGAVRLLDASWRYVETDREHFEQARAHGPVAGAFLHGHTFMLLAFMSRRRTGRWLLMCSKSLDGEAMARAEERLGLRHTTAAALSVQSAIRRGAEPTEELRRENVVEALYVRPEGTDAVVLGTALPAELIAERVMPSVS